MAAKKVITSIPAGVKSNGVKMHPSGKEVYITNGTDGTVNVIDTASNKITHTIKVGQRPRNMALTQDGSKLYVGNGRSNNVSVIDTATKKNVKDMGCVDSGRALAIAAATSSLL